MDGIANPARIRIGWKDPEESVRVCQLKKRKRSRIYQVSVWVCLKCLKSMGSLNEESYLSTSYVFQQRT